jgi:ABC-type glycerol-3-phosphate transport system substrate-binding protein
MIQRILALAAGFLVVAALGGWGQPARSAAPGQPQAAQAIRALTEAEPDAASLVPADFRTVMGYRPAPAPTGPTRSDGGCSSPFGGTPYHFTADCRQHDLGYDLLRYANAKGQPLGPWARKAVDDRFAEQTRARCDGVGCRLAAGFYSGMVGFNSWRQGYGTPVNEPIARLALPVAAGLGTALLLGLLPAPRRRPRPVLAGATA